MDAFLAAEALQALNALNIISPSKKLAGFLIGHKRGRRFFVEKVLPAPAGFWPTLEDFARLDKLFEGKIIGLFAFGDAAKLKQHLFQPFACGRLFLEVRTREGRGLRFKARRLDFEGRFYLEPVELRLEK